MSVPQTLLILGGAVRSQGQGPRVIEQARQRGLRVLVADDAEALASNADALTGTDGTVPLHRKDVDGTVRWALAHRDRENLVAVYAYREYAMLTVASVAEALSLPGNPAKTVARIRDKHACREYLRRAGFRQPRSRRCATAAEASGFLRELGDGPWVVKPCDDRGSLGVTVLHRPEELGQAIGRLPERHRGRFLVEEFQAGQEYSVEGVFLGGRPQVLAVTEKHLLSGSTVELGHITPAPLTARATRQLAGTVTDALVELGLRFGVFHVELWKDGDTVVLGEVHNRPGGDFIHRMVEEVCGVQLHGLVFDDLTGRTPHLPAELPVTGPGPTAAVCFTTAAPGTVTSTGELADVLARPECLAAELAVAPGDEVRPIRESADRPGCAVATAPEAQLAWQRAVSLAALLDVRTAPETAPRTHTAARDSSPASVTAV